VLLNAITATFDIDPDSPRFGAAILLAAS